MEFEEGIFLSTPGEHNLRFFEVILGKRKWLSSREYHKNLYFERKLVDGLARRQSCHLVDLYV